MTVVRYPDDMLQHIVDAEHSTFDCGKTLCKKFYQSNRPHWRAFARIVGTYPTCIRCLGKVK